MEGLTAISFPIGSELYTRFATQIVLCRAPAYKATVKISIIPSPTAQAHKPTRNRLAGFERQLVPDELDIAEVQKIFDEVNLDSKFRESF